MLPLRRFLSACPLSSGHLYVQCCAHSVDAAIIGNDALLCFIRGRRKKFVVIAIVFFFSLSSSDKITVSLIKQNKKEYTITCVANYSFPYFQTILYIDLILSNEISRDCSKIQHEMCEQKKNSITIYQYSMFPSPWVE